MTPRSFTAGVVVFHGESSLLMCVSIQMSLKSNSSSNAEIGICPEGKL
jgi:hypothetical protein